MASATRSSSEPAVGQRHSLRLRIALTVAVTALLVILVQSLAFIAVLDEQQEELIDELLNRQIALSIAAAERGAAADVLPSAAMTFYSRPESGPLAHAPAVPADLAGLAIGNHEIDRGDDELHVAVRRQGGVRYFLAYDVAEHEVRVAELVRMTVVGAVAISLVTLLVIYILAGHLTAGLAALAQRVGAGGGADAPLLRPEMAQEVAVVAAALDQAQARQAAALAREREFTGNLSHELRTPLTVIRSDAELLADLPDLPPAARRRAESIIRRADEIADLTAGLLHLARETRPGAREPVRLGEAAARQWARAGGAPAALSLAVAPTTTVVADPAMLDIVLRNLLVNALRHGADRVHCTFADAALSVRDNGPGVAADDLPHIFSRHRRRADSPGQGLGLALVAQVATACGWQVRAENAVAGGLIVHLTFPASQISHTPLTLS